MPFLSHSLQLHVGTYQKHLKACDAKHDAGHQQLAKSRVHENLFHFFAVPDQFVVQYDAFSELFVYFLLLFLIK